MPSNKSIKFILPEDDEQKSSTELRSFRKSLHPGQDDDEDKPQTRKFRKSKFPIQSDDDSEQNTRTYRKSKYPGIDDDDEQIRKSRISSIMSSRARYSTRITQMFSNLKLKRARESSVFRPIEIFMPTYQMESKKPFDPRIVEDFLNSHIKDRLDEHEKFEFDDAKSMRSLTRKLSEEILSHVKIYEFNRYKIFVSVTIGEKMFQGFNKSVGVLWDVEKDSMASFTYERNNIFGLINVFGVYFD